MLGTLGSFCDASEVSLLLRFLPLDFVSADREDADAGTAADWPGMSLEPLSELEGFEEEHRRWCRKGREAPTAAAALGAEALMEETSGVGGTETTRRTVLGNMMPPDAHYDGEGIVGRYSGERLAGGEGEGVVVVAGER